MLGQFLYAEVWSLTLHKTIKRLCQPHPHKARKGKERSEQEAMEPLQTFHPQIVGMSGLGEQLPTLPQSHPKISEGLAAPAREPLL